MQPGAVVEMIWAYPWETVLLNRSLHLGQTLRQAQTSLCAKYSCAATGVVRCGEGTCEWGGMLRGKAWALGRIWRRKGGAGTFWGKPMGGL